jgi:hypothetical protein
MQSERIALNHDDLVPCQPTDYYFHVPDDPDYPAVPTFDDWRFPTSSSSAWLSVLTDDDNNAAQATQIDAEKGQGVDSVWKRMARKNNGRPTASTLYSSLGEAQVQWKDSVE